MRFVELNSIAVELDAATLTGLPEYCAPTVELELIIVTLRAVTLVTLLLLLRLCETMVVLDPKGVIVLDAVTLDVAMMAKRIKCMLAEIAFIHSFL